MVMFVGGSPRPFGLAKTRVWGVVPPPGQSLRGGGMRRQSNPVTEYGYVCRWIATAFWPREDALVGWPCEGAHADAAPLLSHCAEAVCADKAIHYSVATNVIK